MKSRLITSFILGATFALLTYIGFTKGKGDGFISNPNQAPTGADPIGILFMFSFGALIGFIPWKKIVKKVFYNKD